MPLPLAPIAISFVTGLVLRDVLDAPGAASQLPLAPVEDEEKVRQVEREFLPFVQCTMLLAAKEAAKDGYGAETSGKKANWQMLLAMLPSPEDAVAMFFALKDSRTSWFVKGFVAAALIYLVSPIDVVPDELVPVVGFADDATVIALALGVIDYAVTPAHRVLARVWLEKQAKWVTGLSLTQIEEMIERIRRGQSVGPEGAAIPSIE